jgi:hypothetical protein
MNRSSFLILTGALAVFLPGRAAQADPIPWSITWSSSQSVIVLDNGNTTPIGVTGLSDSHSSNFNQAVPTVAADLTYLSQAGNNPVIGRTFHLTATVTDNNSHLSSTLTFDLKFDGSTNGNGNSLKLTPVPSDALFTPSLGGDIYRVQITGFIPPVSSSPHHDPEMGEIQATVTVLDPPAPVPEPSALLLTVLAAPALGGIWWHRRRRLRPSDAGT